jgi:Tfp pilus assembly protein PilN
MTQQINLCSAAFQPVRQRFSALSLVQGLGALLVVGGGLAAAWAWSLEQSSASYRQTTAIQAKEIASLKDAIALSRAKAGPVDPALLAQLQERRNAVGQRETLVDAVRQGMFKPGEGHSDRMLMMSRSIPASVWITTLAVNQGRLEVGGFTLETQALNEWVDRLAKHPLMRDLKLSAVSVENKSDVRAKVVDVLAGTSGAAPAVMGASAAGTSRPVWSFKLVNLEPPPLLPARAASAPGAKP